MSEAEKVLADRYRECAAPELARIKNDLLRITIFEADKWAECIEAIYKVLEKSNDDKWLECGYNDEAVRAFVLCVLLLNALGMCGFTNDGVKQGMVNPVDHYAFVCVTLWRALYAQNMVNDSYPHPGFNEMLN
jgi:hypothetical protein